MDVGHVTIPTNIVIDTIIIKLHETQIIVMLTSHGLFMI